MNRRSTLAAMAVLVATSACSGARAVPSGVAGGSSALQSSHAGASSGRAADTTSILKKLTKDVVIGSTIDPGNGDEGPRAISIVPASHGLSGGQLVVCNFENAAGAAGDGTTIEILDLASDSTPARFAQSDSIQGCDGTAVSSQDFVYGAGLASRKLVEFNDKGKSLQTYSGSPIATPLSDVYAAPTQAYSPDYVFAGVSTGAIASISVGFYGTGRAVQVAKGFAVKGDGPKGKLGPSGLQYDRKIDTLYIVDGVTNTIVAFSNASNLLEKDEIVVQPDGTTFECKHPKATCATLVYSGSPLQAPMASALLPNGNLIVANTRGRANTLVELTPAGQVLDTKVVDNSSTQGVFGLVASGTGDSNTVLFFTDTNSNQVQELEQ